MLCTYLCVQHSSGCLGVCHVWLAGMMYMYIYSIYTSIYDLFSKCMHHVVTSEVCCVFHCVCAIPVHCIRMIM